MDTLQKNIEPVRWYDVLAALLPFAGFLHFFYLQPVISNLLDARGLSKNYEYLWYDVLPNSFEPPFIFYVLIVEGFVFAWSRGFRRWSLPYLAWLAFILINTFGNPFAIRVNTIHTWLAWGFFLLAFCLELIFTRNFRSFRVFWLNLRFDWTRLSFGLFGLLPFFVWVGYSFMPDPYNIRGLLCDASLIILLLGALGYMLSQAIPTMLAWLLGSAALSIGILTAATTYFWHSFPRYHLPGISTIHMLGTSILFLVITLVALLLPPLLAEILYRRGIKDNGDIYPTAPRAIMPE